MPLDVGHSYCPVVLNSYLPNVLPAIPDPLARRETIAWIRVDFEKYKTMTDLVLFDYFTSDWLEMTAVAGCC